MFGFTWQFLPPGWGDEPEEVESLILPIGYRLGLKLTPCKYAQKVKMRCNTRSPVFPLTKGSWLNLQWASCFLWKENRWLTRGRRNGRTIQQKFFLPGSESKFLGMRAGILLMVLLLQLMMPQRTQAPLFLVFFLAPSPSTWQSLETLTHFPAGSWVSLLHNWRFKHPYQLLKSQALPEIHSTWTV